MYQRLKHDIVKRGPSEFECIVCGQTWRSQSRTRCPGVKLYPRHDYAPLLTQTQLAYMGYQTAKQSLPPPVGCYYAPGAGPDKGYVFLYDPAQAIKKSRSAQRRVTTIVSDIYWPHKAIRLIHDLCDFLRDRDLHPDRTYEALIHEIANIAVHFNAFTPQELEQFAGDILHLSISPSLVHRSYPSFTANSSEQIALACRIAAVYERQSGIQPNADAES